MCKIKKLTLFHLWFVFNLLLAHQKMSIFRLAVVLINLSEIFNQMQQRVSEPLRSHLSYQLWPTLIRLGSGILFASSQICSRVETQINIYLVWTRLEEECCHNHKYSFKISNIKFLLWASGTRSSCHWISNILGWWNWSVYLFHLKVRRWGNFCIFPLEKGERLEIRHTIFTQFIRSYKVMVHQGNLW